jgi:hypothetical protein
MERFLTLSLKPGNVLELKASGESLISTKFCSKLTSNLQKVLEFSHATL